MVTGNGIVGEHRTCYTLIEQFDKLLGGGAFDGANLARIQYLTDYRRIPAPWGQYQDVLVHLSSDQVVVGHQWVGSTVRWHTAHDPLEILQCITDRQATRAEPKLSDRRFVLGHSALDDGKGL